ncbi:outer membrane lipoprotein Omp10 [Agrobacterium sp. ES01]|uniref:outer membrane lipoprotein Omp10 n=1 Tax=Agrobacterium sp. ES01 TaxID=3420714 RepID=UPI003D0E8C6F
MNFKTIVALSVASIALTACYPSGGPRPRPLPPVNQGPAIDGAWVDPNGIVSTFQAGSFSTRTTDTSQLLASGTYTQVSDRLVEINMTSLVRNTQQKVNCALVTPNQLNCTSDSGAQFSLARRG